MPTEVAGWTTLARVDPEAPDTSVGRPLANGSCRVLDADLRSVPAGAVGQLCITGAGVAVGYIERAGLSADRFRPDPFGGRRRLYLTGDRARLRADGRFEVLGRDDRQVKVRGHRIEPDEVEAVLGQAPGVCHAAVAVPGSETAGLFLTGYCVGDVGEAELARGAAGGAAAGHGAGPLPAAPRASADA
ncbi:AMP-binding protein [Nocardiopsis sediminis]|uniref:AMP-binding protein n=1 Tax=Nocardiopsis sediminis TaxID=1778267 RepID=A0ABV8FKG3_9ACTN